MFDKNKQKEYIRVWNKNNPEKIKGYSKKWRENNKEYFKEWDKENRERRLEIDRRYKTNHREQVNKRRRDYYQKNREEEIKKQVIRNRERKLNDLNYAIAQRLRYRIKVALRNYLISGKILYSELINYKKIIEHLKPFPKDISKYHIDHIKPLCSFEFVNEKGELNMESINKAFAPENHRWLSPEENWKKISEDMKLSIKNNLPNNNE